MPGRALLLRLPDPWGLVLPRTGCRSTCLRRWMPRHSCAAEAPVRLRGQCPTVHSVLPTGSGEAQGCRGVAAAALLLGTYLRCLFSSLCSYREGSKVRLCCMSHARPAGDALAEHPDALCQAVQSQSRLASPGGLWSQRPPRGALPGLPHVGRPLGHMLAPVREQAPSQAPSQGSACTPHPGGPCLRTCGLVGGMVTAASLM